MPSALRHESVLNSLTRKWTPARCRGARRLANRLWTAERHRTPGARRCRSVAAEEQELCKGSTQDAPANAHLVSIENGACTVEGALNTSASIREVWEVLTDYEGLQNVFSNISESSIRTISPETVLQQECKWEFLIFSGTFSAELAVKEERAAGRLTFRLIKSSFMDSFVGRWKISELPDGGCAVEHRLTVVPRISPPAFMENYTQRIFVKQVIRILRDLDQELSLRDSDDYGSLV